MNELAVHYDRHRITLASEPVVLTDTEYRLLYELSVNAGQIISRQHFMNRVRAAREPGATRWCGPS